MKNTTLVIATLVISLLLIHTINTFAQSDQVKVKQENIGIKKSTMKLGAFSMSLSVKDLEASKKFYESLGFVSFGGDASKGYLIMKNQNSLIGLFHGMFKGNILTFNPGWDESAQAVKNFDDVRDIQRLLKSGGIKMVSEADEASSGPASFMVTDPDGNVILVDQHVQRSNK